MPAVQEAPRPASLPGRIVREVAKNPIARAIVATGILVGGADACAPAAAPQDYSANLPIAVKQGDPAQAAQHDITVSPTPIPILGSNPVETPTPGGAEPASNTGTGAKPAEAPVPAEAKLSKEQATAMVDDIIKKIQNPDPALLDQYHVDTKALHNDQVIIIYGGEPGDGKSTGGKPYTEASLSYLKDSIGDPAAAKTLIKNTIFPTIRNASFGDVGEKQFTLEDALKIDPKKLFLKFLPRGQSYVGSQVKQEAGLEIIKLYYGL